MITANDVIHGKPSPEPFLKGAAVLGFSPEDCLVFEDSPAGIASARSAGMKAIALQTTYPADQLQAANAIIGTLADVKATLRDGDIALELVPFPLVKS
jgi:mannitol-1-/sugar-/sorbitol-6-phosphatase